MGIKCKYSFLQIQISHFHGKEYKAICETPFWVSNAIDPMQYILVVS